jgi:hypothetical protein
MKSCVRLSEEQVSGEVKVASQSFDVFYSELAFIFFDDRTEQGKVVPPLREGIP